MSRNDAEIRDALNTIAEALDDNNELREALVTVLYEAYAEARTEEAKETASSIASLIMGETNE